MGKLEKAIERIRSLPKDYTYRELRGLLTKLGFVEFDKGRTSGSRVLFYRARDEAIIILHKPHPQDEMPYAAVKDVVHALERYGDI